MPIAKVFKSGNSQAVRLPKEFRFGAAQVEIFRRGDEVVLRELGRRQTLSELLAKLPPADLPEDIPDPPPGPVEWIE
jgi:antitoxin VapB